MGTPPRPRALARLALILATLGAAACQGDGSPAASPVNPDRAQPDLLTLVDEPALDAGQRGRLSSVSLRPGAGSVRLARAAAAPVEVLRRGGAVRLGITPEVTIVADREDFAEREGGDVSWSGPVQGRYGWVQLVAAGDGVTGTVTIGETQYSIEPLGRGLHAITRLNPGGFPPEHPGENPSGAIDPDEGIDFLAARKPEEGTSALAAVSTINVLVVYTASASSAAGNIGNKIQLAVDETNTSYSNSGINISMVRVHSAQITYNESGRSFSQHVSALRSTTDGIMDNVHTLRNTYAADVVVLVVNDSEACGIASSIGSTATTAFAVVHHSCMTGYYSFGHEVGHLQGARHDRFVDSSTSPYAYGHGFIPSTKNWRTVMAYGNNCSNCTRIQWWSNPLKTYPSTGQVMGTSQYEDNARVLNNTAASIAAYR